MPVSKIDSVLKLKVLKYKIKICNFLKKIVIFILMGEIGDNFFFASGV